MEVPDAASIFVVITKAILGTQLDRASLVGKPETRPMVVAVDNVQQRLKATVVLETALFLGKNR